MSQTERNSFFCELSVISCQLELVEDEFYFPTHRKGAMNGAPGCFGLG